MCVCVSVWCARSGACVSCLGELDLLVYVRIYTLENAHAPTNRKPEYLSWCISGHIGDYVATHQQSDCHAMIDCSCSMKAVVSGV